MLEWVARPLAVFAVRSILVGRLGETGMGCWGHPPWWRVENGEDRSSWVHDPTSLEASERNMGRRTDRFVGFGAAFRSASPLVAYRRSSAVDDRNQIARRHDPHDLILGCDSQRARWTVLLRVRQRDHRSSRGGVCRSVGDHRHVVAGFVGSVVVGIDHRDVPRRRVQQTAEDRGEQPRSHRDKHLERWLR